MKAKALPPIAQVLVRRVFASYLGFAILLTGLHVFVEYRSTYDHMVKQFDTVARAFEPTVSVALWNYQDDVLQTIAKGFLEEPAILGVSISELSGKELVSLGVAHKRAAPQDIVKTYPIFAPGNRDKIPIGSLTIHSTHGVVVARVQPAILLLLISAALKTAALWMIITYFSNQLLAKPLLRFAQQLQAAQRAGGVDTHSVDLGPVATDELSSLTGAMDQLIAKVIANEQLLQQVAVALERRASGIDEQAAAGESLDSGLAYPGVRPAVYQAMREAFPEIFVWVTLWDATVIHSPVAVAQMPREAAGPDEPAPLPGAPIALVDFVAPKDAPEVQAMLERVRACGEAACEVGLMLHDERLVRCRLLARKVIRNDLSFIVVLSFDQLKYDETLAALDKWTPEI